MFLSIGGIHPPTSESCTTSCVFKAVIYPSSMNRHSLYHRLGHISSIASTSKLPLPTSTSTELLSSQGSAHSSSSIPSHSSSTTLAENTLRASSSSNALLQTNAVHSTSALDMSAIGESLESTSSVSIPTSDSTSAGVQTSYSTAATEALTTTTEPVQTSVQLPSS